MPQTFALKVNGEEHHIVADPDTPLLYILRNDLGLKGAKFACGLGQCGACRIILGNAVVQACKIPVSVATNTPITTIEGLAKDNNLDPIQEAFIEEQATQCGFCTSGMIIAAKALLNRSLQPTEDEIRHALSGNLCRCGTYDRVYRAVRRAAGNKYDSPIYSVLDINLSEAEMPIPQTLPSSLLNTPELDAWVQFNTDETVTLFTGKMEMGQDLRTSIAMIGAEELDVSLDRIRVIMADTERSPDEGYTASSMSLETSGNAVRYATAEVRQLALSIAYEELEAPLSQLIIHDGTISDPASGRSVTYWSLFGGRKIGSQITGKVQPKQAASYHIVGAPTQRLDLISKVTGTAVFVHDLDFPDMVHARVIHPPNYGAKLVDCDFKSVASVPGLLKVVRDGSWLGVITEREEFAVKAMALLRHSAKWKLGPQLPAQDNFADYMLTQKAESALVIDGTPTNDPIPEIIVPENAAQTLRATYFRPYHSHASLGPSAAVAQYVDGKLTVWSHTQGPYPLRTLLAHVLGLAEQNIHVQHVDGPGCFGHNGADDAALDAALMAMKLPGRPVSLKWTREDENGWEPYGPATLIKLQASVDGDGNLIDWNHDVWGYSHSSRTRVGGKSSSLQPAWYLENAFKPPVLHPMRGIQSGVHRNAEPLYTFPHKRIVKHFISDSPLRVSAQRGLGAYANVFAMESFIDEVAHAVGQDPVTFRLRYMVDQRAIDVIQAVVNKAGKKPSKGGRGMAFAQYKNRQSYVAVVVDLDVNTESGNVKLNHGVIAVDAGQIVNPDGLSNQLEGAFTQSASWTLKEQVTFNQNGITSLNWRTYPILRFDEAPTIETVLINRPGYPYLGIGEGAMGPMAAAIANAIYDAAGIRLREIPFLPEKVKRGSEAHSTITD